MRPIVPVMMMMAAVSAMPAAAREDVVSDLLDCGRLEDPERRLACFDGLAEKYRPEAAARPESADSREPGAQPDEGRAVSGGPREKPAPGPGSEAEPSAPADGRRAGPAGERAAGEAGTSTAPSGEAGAAESVRITSPEDLALPHETRITTFKANRRGDYRFRIEEGLVFERTGGPRFPMDDLTGADITLSKNFLGQWRARVDGRGRELSVRPVQ